MVTITGWVATEAVGLGATGAETVAFGAPGLESLGLGGAMVKMGVGVPFKGGVGSGVAWVVCPGSGSGVPVGCVDVSVGWPVLVCDGKAGDVGVLVGTSTGVPVWGGAAVVAGSNVGVGVPVAGVNPAVGWAVGPVVGPVVGTRVGAMTVGVGSLGKTGVAVGIGVAGLVPGPVTGWVLTSGPP